MSHEVARRQARQVATLADGYGTTFARQVSGVLRSLERRLSRLLPDLSPASRVRGTQLNQVRVGIREALTEAGYGALVQEAYQQPLVRIADAVLDAAIPVRSTVAARLDALRVLATENLLAEGDALAHDLWQATMRGVLGGRDRGLILDDLAKRLDRSEAQMRTLYDTSLSIYGRQVEAIQAGNDPLTVYVYLGPDDEVTRPFCQERVGKEFTREQIDAMENGQIPDVFLAGGGYNCRHLWLEVAREAAEAA